MRPMVLVEFDFLLHHGVFNAGSWEVFSDSLRFVGRFARWGFRSCWLQTSVVVGRLFHGCWLLLVKIAIVLIARSCHQLLRHSGGTSHDRESPGLALCPIKYPYFGSIQFRRHKGLLDTFIVEFRSSALNGRFGI